MSELYLWLFLSALVLGVLWGVYKLIKESAVSDYKLNEIDKEKSLQEKKYKSRAELKEKLKAIDEKYENASNNNNGTNTN
jgi:hypothetical protein